MCFATNSFIARRAWFVSEPYLSYFRAVDEAGGFYHYRWGDACVHMLAVAALLPRTAVLKLKSLAYWHQGTIRLPADLASHARAELSGLPSPPFSDDVGPAPPPSPPASPSAPQCSIDVAKLKDDGDSELEGLLQ